MQRYALISSAEWKRWFQPIPLTQLLSVIMYIHIVYNVKLCLRASKSRLLPSSREHKERQTVGKRSAASPTPQRLRLLGVCAPLGRKIVGGRSEVNRKYKFLKDYLHYTSYTLSAMHHKISLFMKVNLMRNCEKKRVSKTSLLCRYSMLVDEPKHTAHARP